MSTITITKLSDDSISDSRYEIYKDKKFYTGNISAKLKNIYVDKLIADGHILCENINID